MKKSAQKSILLVIAFIMVLTGGGITVVSYNCDSCSGQTLFVTQMHTCCVETGNGKIQSSCCSLSEQQTNHNQCQNSANVGTPPCMSSRLSIDIDGTAYRPQVSIPYVWITEFPFSFTNNILVEDNSSSKEFTYYNTPPDLHPREYLSIIRVLII
ncbi:MAG: hypothetical protein LBV43_11390 [Prevotella sp.]|jgi:hypothetical protein|nr:hypothetical protein [Prevotella sp.]